MNSIVKNGIIIVGLLLVGLLGFYLFVLNKDSVLSSSGAGSISQAQLASAEFLKQMNDIRTLTFSQDFFSDPRFKSFVDFSSAVPTQPIGRANPFATVE